MGLLDRIRARAAAESRQIVLPEADDRRVIRAAAMCCTEGIARVILIGKEDLIRRIAAEGVTILLAAQNANYALQISNYTYVMEWGRITLEGPSEQLRSSDHVRRAYLGATT